MYFYEAIDTSVLDFWWRLLWVSKPEWAVLFTLGRGMRISTISPSLLWNKAQF